MSGRQTSDDAVVEVQKNEFFRRLFGLDQAFEIAFLTVVDGPCYDHLVAAEKPYEALKKRIANNPLLSRTDTPAGGFTDFMVKLGTASDNLDADLGYLVDLAQQRLRPARRLFFSRKPTARGSPPAEGRQLRTRTVPRRQPFRQPSCCPKSSPRADANRSS